MENTIDLTILEKYSNQWVALSSDESKVVSSGSTAKDAFQEALKLGEESPILTKVPEHYSTYIL